jgi:hypothetical protein
MGVAFTHEKPPMKRSRINPKREEPRREPMRDRAYMEWLCDRSCVACRELKAHRLPIPSFWTQIVDPAHTVNNGRGSKGPDSSCIPLCRFHHDEMDGRLSTAITTKSAFAAKYGLDLEHEAATHYATFLIWKESIEECA